MKKIILIGCSLLALACCFSCKKTKSLSELRREERKSISDFIKDNNIEILDAFPADNVFEDSAEYDASTEEYIEALGRVNQFLAEKAAESFEAVCGIPVKVS